MKSEFDISALLQKLRSRELTGKTLPKNVVLEIVEFLKSEGWKTISISSLLGYDPRQVRRFLEEIRRKNGVAFTAKFCSERLGVFIQKTELASEFLIRTYHDANQPIEARIAGSMAVLKYANKTMETLKKLGLTNLGGTQDLTNKEPKIEPVSAKDKALFEKYSKMPPMEREKLREELRREITDFGTS